MGLLLKRSCVSLRLQHHLLLSCLAPFIGEEAAYISLYCCNHLGPAQDVTCGIGIYTKLLASFKSEMPGKQSQPQQWGSTLPVCSHFSLPAWQNKGKTPLVYQTALESEHLMVTWVT